MGPEDATTGGATGAEETPAVGSQSDDALLGTLEPEKTNGASPAGADDEFLKKLESIDPGALPESLRRKLESPFLSQYTQKTTAFDLEKRQLLGLIDRLTQKNGDQPATDPLAELRERVRAGDNEALDELIAKTVDSRVQERTGPQMEALARQNAIHAAAQIMPDLPKYEAQVAKALQEDPDLLRMVAANGYRDAHRVLAGLAFQIEARAARDENKQLKASLEARVKQAVEDYRRKVAGLPPSTSQAGKTPTAITTEDTPSLREAMESSWKETVGS